MAVMKWLGLLLCWTGVLLPLLMTIHVMTESFTVAAVNADSDIAEQTVAGSVESSMFWTQLGMMLFLTGIIVLLMHWRKSRSGSPNGDGRVDSR